MKVYSLIAPTSSEIREVLLSISFNRSAISMEAEILTSAARAVSASSVANNCSSTSGLKFLRARSAASCHKSFCPWLRSRESSSVFQIAGGQARRAEARPTWVSEVSNFSISDFLRRGKVAPCPIRGWRRGCASEGRATGWWRVSRPKPDC